MLKRALALLGSVMAFAGCSEQPSVTELPGATPRELLFDISLPKDLRLSPQGAWVSFTQKYNGARNLWLKPADSDAPPRAITSFDYPGVGPHVWHPSGEYVLFLRRTPETDDVRAYVYDLRAQEVRGLYAQEAQQARFLAFSQVLPDSVYMLSNARDAAAYDIYRVDLKTGANLLVYQDELGATGYFAGPDLKPLIAQVLLPDGQIEWRMRTDDKKWRSFGRVAPEDAFTTRIEMVSSDGADVFISSAVGRETSAYLKVPSAASFKPDAAKVLAENERYDFRDATYDPVTHRPIVAEFATPRAGWVPLDETLTPQLYAMRASGNGQLRIIDAAHSVNRWLIAHENGAQPPQWGVFDAEKSRKISLFPDQDALMAQQAAIAMQPVTLGEGEAARDAFLSLPLGRTRDETGALKRGIPAAIILRGPFASQDRLSYHPLHQWLASRGVAALSFNHLGSSGQGKAHLMGGTAGAIVDDLDRAAAWLKARNMGDENLAIITSGFGSRIGLEWSNTTQTPPQCLTMASPTLNIQNTLLTLPDRLAGLRQLITNATQTLENDAPLPNASVPIMIAHGAENRRQTFQRLLFWVLDAQGNRNPMTLLRVNGAQESFDRGSQARAVMAVMEVFLASCLDFELEPLGPSDFFRSDVELVVAPTYVARAVAEATQFSRAVSE